jgi:hypothetical protein
MKILHAVLAIVSKLATDEQMACITSIRRCEVRTVPVNDNTDCGRYILLRTFTNANVEVQFFEISL